MKTNDLLSAIKSTKRSSFADEIGGYFAVYDGKHFSGFFLVEETDNDTDSEFQIIPNRLAFTHEGVLTSDVDLDEGSIIYFDAEDCTKIPNGFKYHGLRFLVCDA